MPSKFSVALQTGLTLQGRTQTELAGTLGVSKNTVTRWIKDTHLADAQHLELLSNEFGWTQATIRNLVEDWFENGLGDQCYRVANSAFVQDAFGGDFEKLQTRLTQIENNSLGDLGTAANGTNVQWAKLFSQAPYSWKLLLRGAEIIGFWHFICLSDEAYRDLLNGNIALSQIETDMLDFPVTEGKYNAYFCSIAIDPTEKNPNSFGVLNRSLVSTFSAFAKNGILFDRFLATALSYEGRRMCQLFGMKKIKSGTQFPMCELEEIYELEGSRVPTTYWGRDLTIRRAYLDSYSENAG